MSDTPRFLRVGLTGGIASGKTTVARQFAEHGAFVVDADVVAHEATDPGGAAFDAVVERFGPAILDSRGEIDRTALGRIVFADASELQALNAIVHPAVVAETERRIADYAPIGHSPLVVFDAALLVETGRYREFHKLVVVRCSAETQLRRLLARDELTAEDARARIAGQAPLEEKVAVADYVIDTEGTLRETRRQTDAVFALLVSDFDGRFGSPRARTS